MFVTAFLAPAIFLQTTQPASAPPPPTTSPAAMVRWEIEDRSIPEVSFTNTRLDDAIEKLRAESGMNIVIANSSGPSTYPVITSMRLKDVTAPEVLKVLEQSVEGMKVARVTDPMPAGIQFRVISDNASEPTTRPLGAKPGTYVVTMVGEHRLSSFEDSVHTYSLTNYLKTGDASAPHKVEDVLSLVDAVLAETDGTKATLKFHAPTNTLIVKGSGVQQRAVADALNSLQPGFASPPRELRLLKSEKTEELTPEQVQGVQRTLEMLSKQRAEPATRP